MDARKLFQVLVVGGAMLGAGCRDEEEPARPHGPVPRGDAGAEEPDGGFPDAPVLPTDASMTLPGEDAGGAPVECGFCPNPDCCDGPNERPGMVCCWSTSCS